MHANVAGALINSALYLLCTFAAGLATGHRYAWQFALLAMAWAFLSHVVQLVPAVSRTIIFGLIVASWILGAAAFLALFF